MGAAGIGGGEATIAACPSDVPSGSCAIAGQSCLYATTSCKCSGGAWTCTACPAQLPVVTTIQGTNPTACLNQACSYGDVTCSCNGVTTSGWACGVCPAGRPADGAACGNVAFACTYGSDLCACTGTTGWSCQTITCVAHPTSPGPSGGRSNCPGSSGSLNYTCAYPKEGQTCTCVSGFMTCACPAAEPAEGDDCVGTLTCAFGGRTCLCAQGKWQCGGSCPPNAPAPGTACAVPLSCAYPSDAGAGLCSCNGTSWSCQ